MTFYLILVKCLEIGKYFFAKKEKYMMQTDIHFPFL